MTKARNYQEHIDCLFSNGLWIPGRFIAMLEDVDGQAAKKVISGLRILEQSPEPIHIALNSPGGSTIDGMAMYDAISMCSNHVTITVYGEAASMGAVILQAADHRVMAPHAMLMLHDGTDGATDIHCRDFERRAEESKRSREEMYQIFADRSGKSKSHFRRRLGRDCYYTAEQALKEGLIDGIAGRP